MSDSYENTPQVFLLLENSSKANNLGSILRCASAFGITTIVTIGFAKCSVQGTLYRYDFKTKYEHRLELIFNYFISFVVLLRFSWFLKEH